MRGVRGIDPPVKIRTQRAKRKIHLIRIISWKALGLPPGNRSIKGILVALAPSEMMQSCNESRLSGVVVVTDCPVGGLVFIALYVLLVARLEHVPHLLHAIYGKSHNFTNISSSLPSSWLYLVKIFLGISYSTSGGFLRFFDNSASIIVA